MFTCLWQLWDWLESPPLFTATMESKKLQQLQQANSHLAPQPMPQKKVPSTFHPASGDYRPPHSPVFQGPSQYHSMSTSYPQMNLQNPQHQSPSSGSQSTPISTAPQGHMFGKSAQSLYHHQQQQQQQQIGQYGSEQLYQSPQERSFQMTPARTHYPVSMSHSHPHPVAALQQQYQQLQQAKIQQQIQTQNEALAHQQRTFALRQQLNPPIPQSHFHIQSQSFISSPSMQSQGQQPISQAPHRSLPPTTLNLSSQCQPAPGPVKLNSVDLRGPHYHQDAQSHHLIQTGKLQGQAVYQQSQEQGQQRLHQEKLETGTPSDHGPVYIQQNHPGHVVNQACQTQISGAVGKTKPLAEDPKSPSHLPLDRKKSSGNVTALKSPLTKRPASSPVTLSGWLYKQGSEGLKVWRKRWFVLSEYCLYYYKGPEEEKLLGSILLPSYKVAACSPEDKIYRKYAFKCEHTNMRTYWLAAENAEQMCQWVRSLTAATMMQGSSESDQASQPSVSSLNQSGENSDSGIHTFQSQQSKLSVPQGPVTPASDSGGCGGQQPLYANAPPKPKRVNDGGYSSPSPENSIDRCETTTESRRHVSSQQRPQGVQGPMSAIQQKGQHHAIYDTRTGNVTSAVRHGRPSDALSAQFQQMSVDRNMTVSGVYQQHKSPYHIPPPQSNIPANYPPAMELDDHIIRAPQHFNDDVGNDIYGERELYVQRAHQRKYPKHLIPGSGMTYPNVERRTPDAYGRSKNGQHRIFSDYEDIYNLGQAKMHQSAAEAGAYRRPMSPPTYNNDKHVPPMPSRYAPSQLEATSQHVNLRAKPMQPSGIMRPHSADFLEYEARAEAANIKPDPVRAPRPKSSLDINRTPDSFYYSEASYAEKMRQSALYLQNPQNQHAHTMSNYKSQDVGPYAGTANTISYEPGYEPAKRDELISDPIPQTVSSVPRANRHNSKDYRASQSEQFLRSASARLPRKEEDAIKDGERKREESMKRLLEWKQRMLQSPLTRKGAQQGNVSMTKVASTPNFLAAHGIQRSRSETHANAGYNSYSSDDEASISVRNVRNLPKVNLTVKPDPTDPIAVDLTADNQYGSTPLDNKHAIDRNYYRTEGADIVNNYERENYYPLKKSGSRAEIDLLEKETSSQIRNLDMSAGDLLSRTHEELVLLLIQLRRQNSTTARAIEQCCTEIHELQNRIRTSEGPSRSENIQRLNYLKQHLMELEKQYEKSKPLVNLVDNMVKLGSLYRSNENSRHIQSESVTLDRLEFNQKVQERRLLQEEQKHWDRLSPNHTELQSKVRQLYQLDQLLQEESGTLQNLQRDKEDLERALGGLRARLQDTNGHPMALEAAKKQQHVLERELSRVHQLLAENSKKLEQTVAGNARLEQELLILRQKLQASRGSRGSQGALGGNQGAGDSIQYASSTTALLESELRRVQQLVGDMQRQRQELSQAVRQLTENSNALYQQIGSKDSSSMPSSSHIRKRQHSSCWTETDLDSMVSTDHTGGASTENLNIPLYVDTGSTNSSSNLNCSTSSKLSGYDSKNNRSGRYVDFETPEGSGMDEDFVENSFANLSNQEKQEIKTVRIVKRESERRHRDRERSANVAMSIQNLDQVLEEETHAQLPEDLYTRSKSLPRTYNETFEPFKQNKEKKSQDPLKAQSYVNPNAPVPSPTIQMRYNDYYININPYPVSMSDKNSNLSAYNNYNASKDKMSISHYMDSQNEEQYNSSTLKIKTESIQSLTSPIFQSEAARQIISEMSGSASEDNTEKVPLAHKHKRAVPKEKRRHYTAPNNVNAKAMQNIQAENDMNCNNTNWRARDDLDMEVALRPRINAPDVVRSALGHREKISENTIDKLLAAPSKILIPERYIPEKTPELSPEEKKRRQEKVEAIKKMLAEAPINTPNDTVSVPPSKINAEKKQREHLLQLNQILAQQVMQMSKIVAEKAMAALPSKITELSSTTSEEDRSSPADPLPIYQQRENFFT